MNPTPKIQKCRCGEPVLVGWSADMCAVSVTLDVYPMTAAGEVSALRQGLPTYRIKNGKLKLRDRYTIPGHPPSHHNIVVRTHHCTLFVDPAHRLSKLPSKPKVYESAVLPF